jgi:ribonuclease J
VRPFVLEELREAARTSLDSLLAQSILEIKLLQQHLHDDLGQLVYDRTRRRPLILPVVVEV